MRRRDAGTGSVRAGQARARAVMRWWYGWWVVCVEGDEAGDAELVGRRTAGVLFGGKARPAAAASWQHVDERACVRVGALRRARQAGDGAQEVVGGGGRGRGGSRLDRHRDAEGGRAWRSPAVLEADARRGCSAEANPSLLAAVTSKPASGSGFAHGRLAGHGSRGRAPATASQPAAQPGSQPLPHVPAGIVACR